MNLPESPEYLALALSEERTLKDITLRSHRIAELRLETGKLIAGDPFVFLEPQPFQTPVPCGAFPVVLTVAKIKTDQRVAFASIRFRDSLPVRWEMLTVLGQDLSTLKEGQMFGYGVDTGTGCFVDFAAARVYEAKLNADESMIDVLFAAMDRHYVHTWKWMDMPFGNGNLVAFSSGYGDGFYATYAGFDAGGEISVVVTDFSVVPSEGF